MKSSQILNTLASVAVASCGFALSTQSLLAAPGLYYDAGDPTSQEQYLLERINIARANPTAEGQMLAGTTDPSILNNYKYFKVNTASLRSDFAAYAAQPPLALNKSLMASARSHSLDMASSGKQAHDGTDGSKFNDRIGAAGYGAYSSLGENVYAYSLSPFFCHVGLNADWGVSDLGHRKNIMNFDPAYLFKEVGLSVVNTSVAKDSSGNPFGPLVVTQDFGAPRDRGQAFLVGVVYDDRNGNGAYDEGEGLGGVTIMPSQGDYFTVTGGAGGFSIPIPAGVTSLTVTASGGGLGERRVQTVAVTSGTNVKVDFHAQDAVNNAPAQATVGAVATVTSAADGRPGAVQIIRDGGNNSAPLTVALGLSGSAVSGVDYAPLPTTVTIPAGVEAVELQIVTLASVDVKKKVKISVAAGNGYTVPVESSKAAVKILPVSVQ